MNTIKFTNGDERYFDDDYRISLDKNILHLKNDKGIILSVPLTSLQYIIDEESFKK